MQIRINFIILIILVILFLIDCYLIINLHEFIQNKIIAWLIAISAGVAAILIPVFFVFSVRDFYKQWKDKR
jgi:hypothetical protein